MHAEKIVISARFVSKCLDSNRAHCVLSVNNEVNQSCGHKSAV